MVIENIQSLVNINATIVAQVINFLILLFILKKFAYGPLMQVMKEREDKIASSLEAAENDKKTAEALKDEYQKQLAMARTQAQEIVDKAIKIAEESKHQILDEARAENERMLQNARAEIARERVRAIAELKGEVVTLSMSAATKIIGENINEEISAKLVSDFINKIDEEKTGGLPC